MTCATPISFETLVALWAREIAGDEADQLEEHVFGCETCGGAYARLGDMVSGIGDLIPIVLSQAHRDRLAARGMRLQQTPVAAGVDVPVTYAADVDLLVHVLKVDLEGAEHVDLDVVYGEARRIELVQVPFDASRGEVLVACQRHYESNPHVDPTFIVHAVAAGKRREVGRYRVLHTWR